MYVVVSPPSHTRLEYEVFFHAICSSVFRHEFMVKCWQIWLELTMAVQRIARIMSYRQGLQRNASLKRLLSSFSTSTATRQTSPNVTNEVVARLAASGRQPLAFSDLLK